ncbi:protein PF14_0175 isoform X2 [Rhopalosiphum maidis]|uniref:protein PF14_0175 isoform X2 n=1 Tax=Rhopalosiphum maidis TaxID=43146 RepID=UPI000EFF902E|nr:protein PF14_0175 isoform X2 [Rhopalosiphum maidis]
MDADVDSAWISTQAIVSTDIQPDNEREKIHDYGCIVLNGMVDNGRYILKEGDNTIGRHPLNDIYIEHPSVSMNHAVIQCDSDGVVLLDKGSLNKTKLNKKNLRKDVAYFLEENALLMFGEVQADYFINGESNEVTNNSKSIASDNISAHKGTQNDGLSLSKLSNTINTSKSFRTDIPNAITDFNVSLIRNSSTCRIEKEVSQTITGSESAMNTLNDIHTELNSSSPSDEYLLEALSQVETMQNNIHSNKIFNNLSNKNTSIINPTESMPKITREDTPSPVMDLGSSFVTTNITPESIFQSPNKMNTELIREDTPSPVMDLGSSFVTTNITPESIFQSPNKINTELIREDTPSPVMDFGCYNDYFENKLETNNHDVISAIQSPNKDDKFNNTQILEIPNLKSENESISINQSFGEKQNVSMNNFKNSFDADDNDILFCESQKVKSGDQSSIPTTHLFNVPSNCNLSSSNNINSNKQYSVKPAEPLNITKKSRIHNDGLNSVSEQNRLPLTISNLKSATEGHNIDKHKRNVNTFEADDDDIFSNFIEEECKSQQQNLNLHENQDFFNCPTQKNSIPKKENEKPKISSSINEEETQKPQELSKLSKTKTSTSNIDSNSINGDLIEVLKKDNEDFFDCPTQKLNISKKINPKPKVPSTIHKEEIQKFFEFSKLSNNNLIVSKSHSTSIHEDLTQIPEMDDDFFNLPTQKISISKKVNEKPKLSSSIQEEETQKSTEFTQLSKTKTSTSNIDSNCVNEDLTEVLKIDNEDFFDCPTQKLSITKKVHLKPKVSSTIHEQETQNILEFSKPSKNNLTVLKKHSTSIHEELTQVPEMDDDFFNCPTQKYALAKKINEKPILSSSIYEEEAQKPSELAHLSKTKNNTSINDSNSINEDLTEVLKIDNEDFFNCPTQKLSITKKVHLKPKVSSTIHEQETQNILDFSKPSKKKLTVSKKHSTSINKESTQIPEMDDDFFNCPTQKYTMSKNINEKPIISNSIHEEETQKPTELAQLSITKSNTSSIDSTSINENLTEVLKIDNEDFFDCPTQKLSNTKKVNRKSKVSSTIHEQETQNILEFSKPSKNYSSSVQEDLTQIPEMDDDFFNRPTQKISISKNIVEKPKISNSIHEEETQNPTEFAQLSITKSNTSSIDSTSINENLTEVLKIDNEDFFDCPTQKLSTTKKVNRKSKVSSTIHEQETQNILEFSKPSKNYSSSVQEDLTQIPDVDDDFFNRPTQKISISNNIVEKPRISNSIHEEETQKSTELVQFNNTKTSISNTDSINIKKELTKVLKIDNDDFFNCPTQKLSFTKNTDLKPKVSSTVHDEVTQELIDKPIGNIESTSNSNTISKHKSSIQVPEIDNDFFNCPTQNISIAKKINLLANVSSIANKENTQKPAEFSELNKTNTNISKTDFTNKYNDFDKLNNHRQAIEPDNKNVQKSKCINSNTIDLSNVQLPVCNDNSSNSLKINKPKIYVREDLCISYSGNSSNSTNILNKPNENTVMNNINITVPILKNINLTGCSKTSIDRKTDLNTLSSIKQEHLTDDSVQSRVSISRKHNDRLKRMDESIFSPLNIPDISANSLLEHHSSSKTVEDNLNALNCKPSTSSNDASVWKSFWNKKKVQCQVKGKSDKQGNSKITHEVKENKERYQTRAMTRKENASILNRKRKQDGVEESNKKICTRKKILESLVENSTETVVSFSYLKSRHLQEMKQFVDKTGGTVTDEITECSVLVTDKIRCTMKILSAIARGCPIVNANWLKHSYTVQMFQDVDDFLIVDKDAERKYKFQLKESLAKAKTKRLLDGYNVLVTPSVKPGPQEMKVIISCAGGNYVLNWTNTQYSKELIVTCDKDRNRWKPAWDNDFAKIIDSDTLVTSIIRQKLTI